MVSPTQVQLLTAALNQHLQFESRLGTWVLPDRGTVEPPFEIQTVDNTSVAGCSEGFRRARRTQRCFQG
jgi:hypothetical protein